MPQFDAGKTKTAKITLTNPKAKATDYHAWLYMGTDYVPMAEASFSLSAGQSKEVSFTVIMPSVAGAYPVYIGVFSADVLIPPLHHASEDVVVMAPQLPFTYTFSCTRGTCPSATAYGIAVMSGTIKNNNSVLVSQNVKVMWSRYRKLYGDWAACAGGTVPDRENCVCSFGSCKVNPFLVSLAPGGQQSFSYKGYCVDSAGDTVCRPLLAMHYNYYFWLEDDAGGKSNEVMLST